MPKNAEQESLFQDNAEYDAFVDKFKPKKTTDDCYTPKNVYQAVADWVAAEYGLDASKFIRPFWPGGDYEAESYPEGCTVVDNPPFSILKRVCQFYIQRGVPFFLFCPALTPPNVEGVTIVAAGCSIVYENGADISTSFVTNLQPELVLRTAPDLHKAVEAENSKNLAMVRRQVPKYEYPDHVITAALAQRFGKYGVNYTVARSDAVVIRTLDAQKAAGKSIFGYGWLLSDRAAAEKAAAEKAAAEKAAAEKAAAEKAAAEKAAAEKAAAEKAAAERWELSERERRIVASLPSTVGIRPGGAADPRSAALPGQMGIPMEGEPWRN